MHAPTVKMAPTFHAFLVKFAETLVSKPRNNQSEMHSTMECLFQKLAGRQSEHKDEMMSGTGGVEVKMNSTACLSLTNSNVAWF
jgi:hypothetical protein